MRRTGLPFAGNGLVHGLVMGLGIVAGLALFALEVRRRGLRDDRLWVIAGMSLALGGVVSRVGTWWQQFDPTTNEPLLQWWSDGNRSVLAALVGAWIGVHVGKLITWYKPSTGDLLPPLVALAMVIGRIGCLLTELPGRTGGIWGIVVTPAQAALIGGPAGAGLLVGSDDALLELLKSHRDRLEIYLQYDGPSPEASRHHRGADLTRFKEAAIERLSAAGIFTTLVITAPHAPDRRSSSSGAPFAPARWLNLSRPGRGRSTTDDRIT